jgi:LPS O-antigen subunit length determinant protein (WzzB/FepE family)
MPEQQIPQKSKPIVDELLYYLSLIKTIWNSRKTIIISVIIGAITGVIVALNSPNEYSVSTIMVPQAGGEGQSKLGGLGGLAALAGINVSMSQGAELSPLVYPQIVSSIPFQLELMNTSLDFQDYPKPITLIDYYTKYSKSSVLGTLKKYTIGLPRVLISVIKRKPKELVLPGDSSNQPILLKADQKSVKDILDNIVSLEIDTKVGYITLKTRMPEPLAAAQLAQKAQALMQRYITEFKIEKAKADLLFIEGRYNEAKIEFEKEQVSFALVKDRGKNFTSGLPQIESDRIQTRYTIAFGVYQELAKQLEQAKIQVKKDTPVFAIVQPVTVPTEKSKPNRSIILFLWIIFGGVFGIVIVFSKENINIIEKKWNEIEPRRR